MDCSTPGFPVHHQLPEFAQTHIHRVSDAIQPSHPLSSPSPHALSLSESALCIMWPKYWSFSPSSEYLGLISFRIDWFNLLAVHGTLKSLSQHHSSKASVLHRWRIAILSFISWSKLQSYIIGNLSVLAWTNKCLLNSSKTRSGPLSYMLQRATCSYMCNVYFYWCPQASEEKELSSLVHTVNPGCNMSWTNACGFTEWINEWMEHWWFVYIQIGPGISRHVIYMAIAGLPWLRCFLYIYIYVYIYIYICRLLRPWDSLGKNTGVGYHFLLQGIVPTQGLNPGLPHCRQML